MRITGYLQREAVAYVSRETDIEACVAQYVIGEQSRGCLAVASGDTYHL